VHDDDPLCRVIRVALFRSRPPRPDGSFGALGFKPKPATGFQGLKGRARLRTLYEAALAVA